MIRHVMIDHDRRAVSYGDKFFTPTPREFLIITILAQHPGHPKSRAQLLDGSGLGEVYERTIDSHIKRIRRQFRSIGCQPIETAYSWGYLWKEPGPPQLVDPASDRGGHHGVGLVDLRDGAPLPMTVRTHRSTRSILIDRFIAIAAITGLIIFSIASHK